MSVQLLVAVHLASICRTGKWLFRVIALASLALTVHTLSLKSPTSVDAKALTTGKLNGDANCCCCFWLPVDSPTIFIYFPPAKRFILPGHDCLCIYIEHNHTLVFCFKPLHIKCLNLCGLELW